MNSGIQCLSNVYPLTQYILKGQYLKEINRDNPLGSNGALIQTFAELIKEMWNGSHSFVSPWNFKRELSKFATQFSGFNQHDSQEMLSYLLDGIHEDLNRIKKKPYASDIVTTGLMEPEIADLF